LIDQFDLHQALADGAGDRRAEEESRDKIPESGPGNCCKGFEDARGNDGGNGIGGIVPAVREFKRQREENNDEEERRWS